MFCNVSIKDFNQNVPQNKRLLELIARVNVFYGEIYFQINNEMVKTFFYLRKTKTRYHEKINKQKVLDMKQFQKVVKRLFSNASISSNKRNLTENCKLVKTEIKATEVLNSLFSNIVKVLKISQYKECDPIVQNTKDSTL